MRKTSVTVTPVKKEVHIFVKGKMTIEDARFFIKDYQTKTSSIKGAEYELIVDCTDMEVLTQDMTDNLTEVMKMYKQTEFKKVTFQVNKSILKMQLGRIVRTAGLTQSEIVTI